MIPAARRVSLLEAMSALGRETSARTFLAPRGVKRILDPAVSVVLGARGSGKSALARFLVESSATLNDEMVRRLREIGAPLGLYLDAFSQASMDHPDAIVLDEGVLNASDEALRDFWLQHLVMHMGLYSQRSLSRNSATSEPTSQNVLAKIESLVGQIKAQPISAFAAMGLTRAGLIAALDAVENALARRAAEKAIDGLPVTAVYDDLDAVGAFDPTLRARFIRALLAMWSSLSTRYRHLRAKIFLPADLFDTRQFDTIDASKLLANAARLEWDTPSLYRLVLRHLAQHGDDTRAWLRDFGFVFEDLGPEQGWMPQEPTDKSVSQWLGACFRAVIDVNGTRSPVERWIPNRLRDGRDRVAPRTLLHFFCAAAEGASGRQSAPPRGKLFELDDALGALKVAGEHRVDEIRGIYEWVDRLGALRGRVLPLPRSEVERLVERDPLDAPRPTRPRDGRTVTAELVRLGMLRELGIDELLDVPDVFIAYFGARRSDDEAPR